MATLEIVICGNGTKLHMGDDFIQMVLRQRNVNPSDVIFTSVSLGSDADDDYTDDIQSRRFRFMRVSHRSAAKAYNDRIKNSDAQWIMFATDGDMFSDIYSLSMVVNLFPTIEWDIAWMERYDEIHQKNGHTWVNVVNDIDETIHGKLFRTQFLRNAGLTFDETDGFDSGAVFMSAAQNRTNYARIAKIGTRFVPLMHMADYSASEQTAEMIVRIAHRTNMEIIRAIGKTGTMYFPSVMRMLCDAYYFTHMEPAAPFCGQIAQDAEEVYRKNQTAISRIKPDDLEVFMDSAQNEMMNLCNNAFMFHDIQMCFDADEDGFMDWLKHQCTDPVRSIALPRNTTALRKPGQRRVAVFCGTRNVYDCMETSAKSLEYHTPMDRIYFFIEDDQFPSALPDKITCINVSGQKWFDPHGPNYRNAWTYMCLMRAAFAKLLPEESKVLSLDIDVVVNDDISELWDADIRDYFFAGVPETDKTDKNGSVYTNFGVIMMNLDHIRRTKTDDAIIDSLNHDRWGCPEQDAFNHFCAGRILPLPSMYNATRAGHLTAETDVEKISHYAGIKYWKQFKPYRKYARMSWDEVTRNE